MTISKKKGAHVVHPLVPERLRYIFEHRPVLWFEDETAYDAMLSGLVEEHSPEDILDYHAIKELGDTQWHLMRLGRISKAVLEAEIPDVIFRQLGVDYWNNRQKLGVHGTETELRSYALEATQKKGIGREVIDDLISDVHVSYDNLLYRTFVGNLLTISALNEQIALNERRRDDIIRKYENRRGTLKAMRRSLIVDQRSTAGSTVDDIDPH